MGLCRRSRAVVTKSRGDRGGPEDRRIGRTEGRTDGDRRDGEDADCGIRRIELSIYGHGRMKNRWTETSETDGDGTYREDREGLGGPEREAGKNEDKRKWK